MCHLILLASTVRRSRGCTGGDVSTVCSRKRKRNDFLARLAEPAVLDRPQLWRQVCPSAQDTVKSTPPKPARRSKASKPLTMPSALQLRILDQRTQFERRCSVTSETPLAQQRRSHEAAVDFETTYSLLSEAATRVNWAAVATMLALVAEERHTQAAKNTGPARRCARYGYRL